MPELRWAWGDVRTDGLAPLVAFEGCSLWLYRRLKELDAVHQVEPKFAAWLTRSARRIAAQNLAVDAQRDAVVGILGNLNCPHVLLKGAARRLVTDLYPYADARPVGDVDVLLPAGLAPTTWQRLRGAGFAARPGAEREYAAHHHLAPLSNERHVNVELHMSTSPAVAPREAWRRMNGTAQSIGATRVAGATELLWHAVAHALVDSSAYGFRLRFFLDAAAVWTSSQDIDWTAVASRLETAELPDTTVARRWLGAAAWLAGRACPTSVAADVAAFDLAAALRWRLQVFRWWARGRPVVDQEPWGMGAIARARRLLIDEATRATVGLPITPRLPGSGPLRGAGRWAAGSAARLCFRGWRMVIGRKGQIQSSVGA